MTGPDDETPEEQPAALEVRILMTGNGSDADGFDFVLVDLVSGGERSATLMASDTVRFEGLVRREHRIEVRRLATHCIVTRGIAGLTPKKNIHFIDFAVDCFGRVAWVDHATEPGTVLYLDESGEITTLIEAPELIPGQWLAEAGRLVVRSRHFIGGVDECRIYIATVGEEPVMIADLPQKSPRWNGATNRILLTEGGHHGCIGGQLAVYDASSLALVATLSAESPVGADWSPDGSKIAYNLRDGVWVHDVATDTRDLLYEIGGRFGSTGSLWSPDGASILTEREYEDPDDPGEQLIRLLRIPVEGGDPIPLSPPEHSVHSSAWSPDGQSVAYVAHLRDEPQPFSSNLYVVAADGGTPTQATTTGWLNTLGSWTSEGDWIVVSGDGGDIWMVPRDGGAPRLIVDCERYCFYPAVRGGAARQFPGLAATAAPGQGGGS